MNGPEVLSRSLLRSTSSSRECVPLRGNASDRLIEPRANQRNFKHRGKASAATICNELHVQNRRPDKFQAMLSESKTTIASIGELSMRKPGIQQRYSTRTLTSLG